MDLSIGMCLNCPVSGPGYMKSRVHEGVYKFQVPTRVYENWWSRVDLKQLQVRDDYKLLWIFLRRNVSSGWALGLT
jgi:hypothetical protein